MLVAETNAQENYYIELANPDISLPKKKKHLLELYDYSICPFLTLLEEVVGKEAGSGAVEPKVEEDYYKN